MLEIFNIVSFSTKSYRSKKKKKLTEALPFSLSIFLSSVLTLKLYFQESPPVSSAAAIKNMTNDALHKCNNDVSKISVWKTKIFSNINIIQLQIIIK